MKLFWNVFAKNWALNLLIPGGNKKVTHTENPNFWLCSYIYIYILKNYIYFKNSWGFVTIYPIDFGYLRCCTDWGYPKYCYNKPGQNDYTIKLKRNGVMNLPNYLDIEESVVLRFLSLPTWRLPCLPLFQG